MMGSTSMAKCRGLTGSALRGLLTFVEHKLRTQQTCRVDSFVMSSFLCVVCLYDFFTADILRFICVDSFLRFECLFQKIYITLGCCLPLISESVFESNATIQNRDVGVVGISRESRGTSGNPVGIDGS